MHQALAGPTLLGRLAVDQVEPLRLQQRHDLGPRFAVRNDQGHGELFGIIPYDFRVPDIERAKRRSWDPQSARILTPATFGVGWSVNLGRLARLAGISHPASVLVDSLVKSGTFRHAVLSAGQIMDPDSLLALRVNGADLSLDHGYPARVIVPANPGVHNTKWVASLTFAS